MVFHTGSTSIVLLNLHLFSHNVINKMVNNGNPSMWSKALVTPVPKKAPPTDFCHLRPISVTSIMSRVTERLVRKYLLPAFWPPNTWPVCTLAYWIHHICFDSHNTSYISRLLESSSPPNVLLWIINFLSGRTHAGALFVRPNFWLVTGLLKHHTKIRYWPLPLPGVCFRPANFVALQCYHQVRRRYYIIRRPTQFSWHPTRIR